ncbi:HAD-IA family hydrolase [Celerinatantimonas sp. MCCC 1A17872]|uniref:HAD-IA family hydrolase n=1 Tax=Celerinatantimonas sp. MCCC 1A17872 TaxID=3177514 RepID=UPI0038C290DD
MLFFRSWHKPSALSFDLDDTLYDNHPNIHGANQWMADTLADEIGRRIDWSGYKSRVLSIQPELIHDVTECRRAWLALGLKEQGISGYQNRADDLMQEFVAVRSDFTVPKQSHAILAELAEKIPLVAMTNGNVDIERIGIRDYFSHVYYAGGPYRQKPWPDLFAAASKALALPAHSIAHIGDDALTDVYGALVNGYQAIWFNDQDAPQPLLLPHLMINQLSELLNLL